VPARARDDDAGRAVVAHHGEGEGVTVEDEQVLEREVRAGDCGARLRGLLAASSRLGTWIAV